MQNEISNAHAGPAAAPMKKAIDACVHCGFCLPTCPPYVEMGDEMNSPRGRIFLMKEALENRIEPADIETFIDNCLGCQACTTACPSGVEYGELISPYRAWAEEHRKRTLLERLQRMALLNTIPRPNRFRTASALAKFLKPIAKRLPAGFRSMIELAPAALPEKQTLETLYPAQGKRVARVALLAGCAQQALAPRINLAAIRVLNRHGVEVVVPPDQGCCGALAMHTGAEGKARKAARRNFDAFPEEIDAVISTAAGCGSGMKEYPILFEGVDEEEDIRAAGRFSEKVQDICEFLDALGFTPPAGPDANAGLRVAYHDACHLAHAQRIRSAPRRLLASLPGITLLEPADWEICCGSAGTYNIEHPDTAKALGAKKADRLLATNPEVIATGNIGCLTQIGFHLGQREKQVPIVHTVELLDDQSVLASLQP